MAWSGRRKVQNDGMSGPRISGQTISEQGIGSQQDDFVRTTWALVLSYSGILAMIFAAAFFLAGCETTLRVGFS